MAVVPCLAFCVLWSVSSDLFPQVAVSEERPGQYSQYSEILMRDPHQWNKGELLPKCSFE